MSVWHLVFREIGHRKLNFLLGLISVTVAVAVVVGAMAVLRAGEIHTAEVLENRQLEVREAGIKLEDAMRKITKGLGFNILIIPEDQDLNQMHIDGAVSKAMPEEYVTRLASSQIVAVNHLLPCVMKKMVWPEQKVPIVLYGTRGEVPLMHADPKKPLLDAVPPGRMIVGHELARQLDLGPGAKVTLLGKSLEVIKTHEQRGTIDDSTVWLNLGEAQEMLGMENLIHAILALKCQCVGNQLSRIRAEIQGILPGTQVIERGPPALARAEARNKAKETAQSSLARDTASRIRIQSQREDLTAVLVPLILCACAIWIGFLALVNVRQRREEIGILRAIGYRASQILVIFLGKALLIGLSGAMSGYLVGFMVGVQGGDLAGAGDAVARLFDPGILVQALVLAPFLSALGTWLPALLAAGQDPAVVLQEG